MYKEVVCIYHGDCTDGFAAAWAMHNFTKNVHFMPMNHDKVYVPDVVNNAHVFLLDFCYKKKLFNYLIEIAKTVTVIDHHETIYPLLKNYPEPQAFNKDTYIEDLEHRINKVAFLYDKQRSGCGLAWDYFSNKCIRPELLNYIEDIDLWKHSLPNSDAVFYGLDSFNFDFSLYTDLMHNDSVIYKLIDIGEPIKRKIIKDIYNFLDKNMRFVTFNGITGIPVANVPGHWASEAGAELSKNQPFAITYYDSFDGRSFSLRSDEKGMNVAKIAEQYGGGGHYHASGFFVPFDQLSNELKFLS